MIGAGKYDDLCSYVHKQAKSEGAVVIILGGTKGDGFSAHLSRPMLKAMPKILRHMADEMERGRKELG